MDERMIFLLILGGRNTEPKGPILKVGYDDAKGFNYRQDSWSKWLYLEGIVVLS